MSKGSYSASAVQGSGENVKEYALGIFSSRKDAMYVAARVSHMKQSTLQEYVKACQFKYKQKPKPRPKQENRFPRGVYRRGSNYCARHLQAYLGTFPTQQEAANAVEKAAAVAQEGTEKFMKYLEGLKVVRRVKDKVPHSRRVIERYCNSATERTA